MGEVKPGWTLVTVGRELAVTNTAVRHILAGIRYPSIMLMRRIERVYKWPISEQIQCIPDLGNDLRYATEFRYWLGQQCPSRSGTGRQTCDGCDCPVVGSRRKEVRDPERIPVVLAKLGEYWTAHPDLRLGQILGNLNVSYYTEDDLLLDRLEEKL